MARPTLAATAELKRGTAPRAGTHQTHIAQLARSLSHTTYLASPAIRILAAASSGRTRRLVRGPVHPTLDSEDLSTSSGPRAAGLPALGAWTVYERAVIQTTNCNILPSTSPLRSLRFYA